MNKKNQKNTLLNKDLGTRAEQKATRAASKKLSEYGKQLFEKQKVKKMYGLREKQFRRFFKEASRQKGAAGENLLIMLEQRLDNILYRLKLAVTRLQARQIVVHGHVLVNGKRVYSPSLIVETGDVVSFVDNVGSKEKFLGRHYSRRSSWSSIYDL